MAKSNKKSNINIFKIICDVTIFLFLAMLAFLTLISTCQVEPFRPNRYDSDDRDDYDCECDF